MAKIAINLVSTEQGTGRKLQKTLTDINPEATSAQIKTFATALNNLTTNVYGETNRIHKLNIDTEEAIPGNIPITFNLEYVESGEYRIVCPLLVGASEEFFTNNVKVFVDGELAELNYSDADTEEGFIIYVDPSGLAELPLHSIIAFVGKYAGYYIKE